MADQAKARRTETKRQFTRSLNALDKLLKTSDILIVTVKRRFSDLKTNYDCAQKAHDSYVVLLGTENIAQEDNWIEELSTKYYEIEVHYDNYIDKRTSIKSEENVIDNPKAEAVVNKSKPTIQLERMKFKEFNGDIRRYPRFKEDFDTHIKPLCDVKQLPFVLKSYLCQELSDDVDSLGDNINEIWARLDRRFGNQSRLIDVILSDVKNIDYCGDNDELTLKMIKTIERAYCDLKLMNKVSEMNNTTIMSTIEEKMPVEMAKEWLKIVTKTDVNPDNKFELLRKLMDEWRNQIEYKLANIRKISEKRCLSNHMGSQFPNNGKRSKCWLHKMNGDHPIWRCRLFQNKPVKERIQLVKENNACYRCLETGHTSTNCPRGFKCTEENCNQPHNRLLHETKNLYQNTYEQKMVDARNYTGLPLQ